MGWLSGHGAHPPDRVRILSRNGNDWTSRFPSIATAAEKMRPATMILDDEAVVLDEQGRSDFGLLQHALGGRPSRRGSMTAERWMRFYPSDWLGDPALRTCSYGARGLWIDMLCLMDAAKPRGHLKLGRQKVDA